jgi:hypothetical protein
VSIFTNLHFGRSLRWEISAESVIKVVGL